MKTETTMKVTENQVREIVMQSCLACSGPYAISSVSLLSSMSRSECMGALMFAGMERGAAKELVATVDAITEAWVGDLTPVRKSVSKVASTTKALMDDVANGLIHVATKGDTPVPNGWDTIEPMDE